MRSSSRRFFFPGLGWHTLSEGISTMPIDDFFFPFTSQEKCSIAHHFAIAHKGRLNVGTGPLLFLTTSLCGYQEQTLPRLSRQPAVIQSFPERSVSLANNHPFALSRCWTEQPITGELRKHDIIVLIVHIVQPVHTHTHKLRFGFLFLPSVLCPLDFVLHFLILSISP